MTRMRYDHTLLTDMDIYLFKQGRHYKLYDKLGAHPMQLDGQDGVQFGVWAPNATAVAVMGDFNDWQTASHPLQVRGDGSGIWEGFVPGLGQGELYKYAIIGQDGQMFSKTDPFAFFWETAPQTASVVWDLDYRWQDETWMEQRHERNHLNAPMSVYEVHPGSWRQRDGRFLSYRELAEELATYVQECGFTHVEFMPVMEHPFYGSWGYQTLGFFAPSSRYGTPQDFMYLMEYLHQEGIGVILDWVPSHFPQDAHGLVYFDGTHLFEHADPKLGFHPEWKSAIFNYARYEVQSFLISSANFWIDRYHADGLRVDGVASMLYLDYAREDGEWIPNEYGGRENLGAIDFLRNLNSALYGEHPDIITAAEESTDWPMVTRPVHVGGLGFGLKWNMGWMHDTLDFLANDPVYRKYHHNQLTFSIMYAFSENFILPLSHDEVVYGKGSLINKMPGDDWQKRANLRLMLGYMYTHPGKKLLFMGGEIGQWNEWNHDTELDWWLLDNPDHQGLRRWVGDLNRVYRDYPALSDLDFQSGGFAWIDCSDWEQSVISYLRWDASGQRPLLVVANFTPMPRANYRIGVPFAGLWHELLNSDAPLYGGSGQGNMGGVTSVPVPAHGFYDSLTLTLPPLAVEVFTPEGA
ncbi:1,4-alpha-glucan branching protein GlgB [Desulfohalobium retbaense]|uniref:1,4-alpha-glucan branching enzyme GlgB n=1 Tax=Desulfohalobium retbaense (strain ATCC 49708 / DSM 5692 / JCM 16813 / HR100) TaxID=485915 RepID=C8WZ63_DESRD|nr:1,4-alpha-glucan branching protein GlgB [Desulfohalobium retbaense]ACV67338.1 1,4-alpha-glucan branching enzyme [Desulfohalobium retbaense DSM 5692]